GTGAALDAGRQARFRPPEVLIREVDDPVRAHVRGRELRAVDRDRERERHRAPAVVAVNAEVGGARSDRLPGLRRERVGRDRRWRWRRWRRGRRGRGGGRGAWGG